jgi:hypothetical protein
LVELTETVRQLAIWICEARLLGPWILDLEVNQQNGRSNVALDLFWGSVVLKVFWWAEHLDWQYSWRFFILPGLWIGSPTSWVFQLLLEMWQELHIQI